jgi:hypothetical protein
MLYFPEYKALIFSNLSFEKWGGGGRGHLTVAHKIKHIPRMAKMFSYLPQPGD